PCPGPAITCPRAAVTCPGAARMPGRDDPCRVAAGGRTSGSHRAWWRRLGRDMELVKYTHSCVRIEDGDRSLVIDPGEFSEVETALSGTRAVLVTHEHFDHVAVQRLVAAAGADSELRIWAPASVAAKLSDIGDRVTTVEPGAIVTAGGFTVRVFGGQHAMIHRSVPVIPNVGYLVEETVYHPGDSFDV